MSSAYQDSPKGAIYLRTGRGKQGEVDTQSTGYAERAPRVVIWLSVSDS